MKAVSLLTDRTPDGRFMCWRAAVFRVRIDDSGNAFWTECPAELPPPQHVQTGHTPPGAQFVLGMAQAYAESIGLPFIRGLGEGSTESLPNDPLSLLSFAFEPELEDTS